MLLSNLVLSTANLYVRASERAAAGFTAVMVKVNLAAGLFTHQSVRLIKLAWGERERA